MEYDLETGKELVDNLLEIYYTCEKQCSAIEKIIDEFDIQKKSS